MDVKDKRCGARLGCYRRSRQRAAGRSAILSDVKEMKWRFWHEGWQEKWTDIAHQPDGVELNLTMENGETWRWVFLTPGDMPEIQTAPKETNADPTQPQRSMRPSP